MGGQATGINMECQFLFSFGVRSKVIHQHFFARFVQVGVVRALAVANALAKAFARAFAIALACTTVLTGPAHASEEWDYRVAPGDTLISIAARLLEPPADWRALKRLNQIANPRRLQPNSTLRIPFDWLRSEGVQAEIAAVVGSVTVAGSGPAQAGMKLRASDAISTGEQSSVLLRFGDGTQVLVTERSRVSLQRVLQLRGTGVHVTTLELLDGATETLTPPGPRQRFEIRTPVLDLGVRGTEFRARFDASQQRAHLEVLRGQVAASRTAVDSGFGVVGSTAGVGSVQALLAAPGLGALPGVLERLPLAFDWPAAAAPGATSWRAQVLEQEGAQRLLLNGRFASPKARWSDLPDGLYRLRVRGIAADGLEGRHTDHLFRLKARPEPPLLLEPAIAQRVVGEQTRFAWTASRSAADVSTRYRLQVASSADFTTLLHDVAGLTQAESTLTVAPGAWFWRVASVRLPAAAGAAPDSGPWSDPQPFEQQATPPPPPPPPAAPAAEKPLLDDGQVLLRWAVGSPGARYQMQLSDDAAFARVLQDRVLTEPSVRLEKLPAGRYLIRLRTMDAEGTVGPWGVSNELQVPTRWSWWWLSPALVLLWLL